MSVIKVSFTVAKLSNVLSLFDVVKVYRSTTGVGGPYSEITTPATRIPLLAGQSVYVYDDVAGDPAYYYKTSYYNSVNFLESSLSEAILGSASNYYVSVDEIRAEGVLVSVADDARVLSLIKTWQAFIERVTRQWFVPRAGTWEVDGSGSTLMQLPVPIVSVTALYVNSDFETALPADEYEVYNGRGEDGGRDDRKNPRIKLVTGETSIFTGTGPLRNRQVVFEIGEKNHRIVGSFGYVEADGTTPEPIKYALRKLVVRSSTPMAGVNGGGAGPAGPVIEEETDRHRKRWADPLVGSKAFSTTGDLELDQILALYKSPFSIKAPRTMWRRLTGGAVL